MSETAKQPERIRVICGWCCRYGKAEALILDDLGPLLASDIISHGVCPECYAMVLDNQKKEEKDEA